MMVGTVVLPRFQTTSLELLDPVLGRTQVAEALIRAFLVVPADPVADRSPGLREILKQMLPYALLLQAAEEALDHAIQLRGVGGDELPAETVAPEVRSEPATLEYQSFVAPENGSVSLSGC